MRGPGSGRGAGAVAGVGGPAVCQGLGRDVRWRNAAIVASENRRLGDSTSKDPAGPNDEQENHR